MNKTNEPKPSTAKTGNPRQASRGAAVQRAKRELGNAIDERIAFDVEAMELELLAQATGIPCDQVRERLAVATLEQLTAWREAIEALHRKGAAA